MIRNKRFKAMVNGNLVFKTARDQKDFRMLCVLEFKPKDGFCNIKDVRFIETITRQEKLNNSKIIANAILNNKAKIENNQIYLT